MKDSAGLGVKKGLTIPVLCVKRSDGVTLEGGATCSVKATKKEEGCVICRDDFSVGCTAIRMPNCTHCFHEACALAWLKRSNTCPVCRRELPTDDERYEEERRRTGRTSRGGDGAGGRDWEDIFG